ncbi:MAG: RNA polymerase sigma factor RpoD/SigA [Salibacteraceae bacterium]
MRQLKITKQLTNRNSRSIEKYLTDVSRQEMITAEEEVELSTKIKEGDMQALQKLVNANLRFVISVAKQYQGSGLNLEDLIAEGNIGLITAAQKFDHTKGFKFISYAVWWIRQSILNAISENSKTIRLPQNKLGHIRKLNQAQAKLEQELGRLPTHSELADMLESNATDVENLAMYAQKQISADAPMVEGEDNSLLSVLKNDDAPVPNSHLILESLHTDLERILTTLKGRDADVVRLSFGLGGRAPMSLDEIARYFGLSRERIRQIREKAIKQLRRRQNLDLLLQYL